MLMLKSEKKNFEPRIVKNDILKKNINVLK